MSKVTGFESGPTSSGLLTWHAATLDCGHRFYSKNYQPVTAQLGEEVSCESCNTNCRQVEWLEALDAKTVHHVRYRPRFGGTYTFYKLDYSSPSNFLSIGGTYATPEIDEILKRKGLSPLSPTEVA